jgi:6-phosphogluconolactonase (cycloisomerase 2 family)
VDFHPTLPCLYVSVERQNELHVYRHRDGVIDEQPAQVMSTLAPGKRPAFPQYAGAVHVHPQGRFVFVANRDDPHAGAEDSHLTGDNTMAVFAIDAQSGTVAPPRHYELDAYHVRTFSLQPPWLVAASQGDVTLEGQGAATRWVPASLGVFRISPDGALSALHRTPVPAGTSMLFWCAFPAAYRSRWD